MSRILKKNGWYDLSVQHVGDEPGPSKMNEYRILCGIVRKFMPGVTWAWMLRTFLPLLGMLPVVGLGHYAICHLFESDMLRLCFGALLGAALMGVLAIPIFRNLRKK